MKVAPIVVFLFRDTEGFASTISQAFRPKPSSSFTRQEDSFELSLEAYGIKHLKASGSVSHFVDDHGAYKVTIVAMEHYEPPLPTFFLIGQASQYLDNKSTKQQEILHAIGEILASTTDLQFSEDRVVWNPKKASGESKEPWRALYG
ncbi:uncharacterized protein LOC114425021 isoform X2 [Glycine soja]|uniref:uncharacterized protein isoform X1 n=1 Tax=Glycine max TaxID=3847 RepID=UPI0003DEB929|nr:uncharacterized protein LOC100781998 isoform X1 [Glycine max]XP_028247544.1 uncharacterized protein LOC114425021 isoform X2 [Glycine soja]|eukprot:XP_006586666.1 uncharacterized protein LOC100781998 isoform X1 [Glycine max]